MTPWVIWLLILFSLVMSVQAAYTLYLMLYTWDQSETYEAARAPRPFRRAQLSFTALLPARHEEAVIGRTIERVMRANYPRHLVEAIVVCEARDEGTIRAAEHAITALADEGITGARIITFDDGPINKPHGLNKALPHARHDVVTIFDAEDDIHPDIFNVVNTVMLNEGVRVVQSGVQLMNYNSTWFSAHNVLEYYFWFKSRLHVHAKNGMTPLGGNTVFFQTRLLREMGGWDERNLTEDADIGIRLSARGEPVRVVYDDAYVTQEETPPDLKSFVKQRTRWNQGFLQTLRKGDWRKVPRTSNRLMALYILAFPFIQTILGAYVPISLIMMLRVRLPVLVTLPLLLPGYMLVAHYLLTVVGLHEFAQTHKLRLPRFWVLTGIRLLITYFPYQWVLGFAAVNALWRELRGVNNWEKTAHVGAHRELGHPIAPAAAGDAFASQLDEVTAYAAGPVVPADRKLARTRGWSRFTSRRVRYGSTAAWLLGLVACATFLGPFHPVAGRVNAAMGQVLRVPFGVRHAPIKAQPASAPRRLATTTHRRLHHRRHRHSHRRLAPATAHAPVVAAVVRHPSAVRVQRAAYRSAGGYSVARTVHYRPTRRFRANARRSSHRARYVVVQWRRAARAPATWPARRAPVYVAQPPPARAPVYAAPAPASASRPSSGRGPVNAAPPAARPAPAVPVNPAPAPAAGPPARPAPVYPAPPPSRGQGDGSGRQPQPPVAGPQPPQPAPPVQSGPPPPSSGPPGPRPGPGGGENGNGGDAWTQQG